MKVKGGKNEGTVEHRKSPSANRMIRTLGVNALARHLGVSAAHVSQVMSGKRVSRRVTEAARGRTVSVESVAV